MGAPRYWQIWASLILGLAIGNCAGSTDTKSDEPAREIAFKCSSAKLRSYSMAAGEPAETIARSAFTACTKEWMDLAEVRCKQVFSCDALHQRNLFLSTEKTWISHATSVVIEERALATRRALAR